MKIFTRYVCTVVFFAISLQSIAQNHFPEQRTLKEQQYKLQEEKSASDAIDFKMNIMDEILFSEDFADSLNGNPGNGLWTRDGQHGLIWLWDFNGPDGPLIQNGAPLASTTSDNGFFIFDADAADPAMIGNLDRTGFLVSPLMDLSEASSAIIQFQQFFNYCCYDFSPLSLGVSSDGGVTWTNLDAIPGYSDGANSFSSNPLLTNIDISPYVAGQDQVKVRFGYNPDEYEAFTHYFWAVDDIIIFVNPVEFDLALNDMYITDINNDYEYLLLPEAQANNLSFTAILTNNGGQVQTGAHAVVTILDPFGSPSEFSSDTISLNPGVRDTLYISTSLSPDNIGLYNCNIEVISDQNADDEDPDNNMMGKSFNTNMNIMAHEHGTFFDGGVGSRPDFDNPGIFKEFALGAMFKMQSNAVLDGIQVQVADSSDLDKTIYPVIYRVISGGIQGQVFPVEGYSVDAMLDGHAITEDDLLGESFNISLSNTVTLEVDEYYMIALYSEQNTSPVYFKVLYDGDSDLSTIRFGLDQFGNDNWFNGYNFTPAIRLNFDISLTINEDFELTEVKAYPNPASEIITIDFSTNYNDQISLFIYDMTGKRVLEKDLGSLPMGNQKVRLNISGLNSGLYFYELRHGETSTSNKFIVR